MAVPESSVGRIGRDVNGGLEIIGETLVSMWGKVYMRRTDDQEIYACTKG